MQRKVKAVMLSAFVLPGLGQIYMGERIKGGVFLFFVNIFLFALLFIVMKSMGSFLLAARNGGVAEAMQLLETIRQNSPELRWLFFGFTLLWIYSIVDAIFCKPKNGV
jgi:TM2 domain-containing membrane protein YozV